jgi:hypothetical protein
LIEYLKYCARGLVKLAKDISAVTTDTIITHGKFPLFETEGAVGTVVSKGRVELNSDSHNIVVSETIDIKQIFENISKAVEAKNNGNKK